MSENIIDCDNQIDNLRKLDDSMRAYYERQCKALLMKKYEEYPHIIFSKLKLIFSVPSNSKNIKLIHIILDNIPNQLVQINDKRISIIINTEEDILQQLEFVSDILSIIKSWKKVSLQINDIDINPDVEFDYFIYAFFAQKNKDDFCFISDVDSVRRKYSAHRNTERKTREEIPIKISRDNLGGSLLEIINSYIKLYCNKYHINFFEISEYDRVIVIEDVLIVNFRLLPHYWTQTENYGEAWSCPYLLIQELTPNDLFKFNTAHFRRCLVGQRICMDYLYFKGFDVYRKEIDNLDVVIKALPELKIHERIEQYSGKSYHFVILRMEDIAGNVEYGIGYTKNKIHNFIIKLSNELEQTNSRSLELYGINSAILTKNFINAFLSWKGTKKLWRLENKFSYFYEDVAVKNQWELDGIAKNILAKAYEGMYDNCEFGTYQKPINRWKSEESVYNITKKLYKNYNVIYQYRPFYLSTDGGNMSYDVYICGLKVAIEYQGKQHFEPVDYFGGVEHFEQQRMRDKLKLERSIENGIKVVYVNYWEDITPELIKTKIDEALLNTNEVHEK